VCGGVSEVRLLEQCDENFKILVLAAKLASLKREISVSPRHVNTAQPRVRAASGHTKLYRA
jgi:hypothetical protein